MIQPHSLHSKYNSQAPSLGPSQTGWPDFVYAMRQQHRAIKSQRRLPKSRDGPVHEILLSFLCTETAASASAAVTPQVLLNQQISILLLDSNRDLLGVSFQRTFKHDAHTYSHIICVPFTSVYAYFYKNDTMRVFYGERIVIFFWKSPTTTAPCCALLFHLMQQGRVAVFPEARQMKSSNPASKCKDSHSLVKRLHLCTLHSPTIKL